MAGIKRNEFILEEMRQTGCLAIEAAQRWEEIELEVADAARKRLKEIMEI